MYKLKCNALIIIIKKKRKETLQSHLKCERERESKPLPIGKFANVEYSTEYDIS